MCGTPTQFTAHGRGCIDASCFTPLPVRDGEPWWAEEGVTLSERRREGLEKAELLKGLALDQGGSEQNLRCGGHSMREVRTPVFMILTGRGPAGRDEQITPGRSIWGTEAGLELSWCGPSGEEGSWWWV